MDCLTENDILKLAMDSGIIDMSTIRQQVEMNERKKYIESHDKEIWQGNNGYWYTYIPDETAKSGRRLIKKKNKKDIEDTIISFKKGQKPVHTVKKVFNEWVNEKLNYNEIQKQTYDRYLNDFKKFFGTISQRDIRYITDNELEKFIKETITSYKLTAKRWSSVRLIINGTFKYAKKRGYTDISISSFMGDLELSRRMFEKKVKDDSANVFTIEETKKIIEELKKEPNGLSLGVVLAFQLGLRAGEISSLKWEDYQGDILEVCRTEIHYKSSETGNMVYEVRESTKGLVGYRRVVLTDEARQTIELAKELNPNAEYLFAHFDTRTIAHDYTMKLYRTCDKLGLPRRSLHKARKTYATRLLNANVSEKLIENQMGHVQIDTTKGYYWYRNTTIMEEKTMLEQALRI